MTVLMGLKHAKQALRMAEMADRRFSGRGEGMLDRKKRYRFVMPQVK